MLDAMPSMIYPARIAAELAISRLRRAILQLGAPHRVDGAQTAPLRSMKTRLRALRTERGWSQSELAERLGVSRQTISSIETERYEPSLTLAFRIAALFGATIESVFQPAD